MSHGYSTEDARFAWNNALDRASRAIVMLRLSGYTWKAIGKEMNRTKELCRFKYLRAIKRLRMFMFAYLSGDDTRLLPLGERGYDGSTRLFSPWDFTQTVSARQRECGM